MLNFILGFALLSVSGAYCPILSSVGEPQTVGRSRIKKTMRRRLKKTMSDDEGFEQEEVCSCVFLNNILSQKGLAKFTYVVIPC